MEVVNFPMGDAASEEDAEVVDAEVEMIEVPLAQEAAPSFGLVLDDDQPAPMDEMREQQVREEDPPSRPRGATTRHGAGTRQTGSRSKTKFIASLQLPAMETLSRMGSVFGNSPVSFILIAVMASIPGIIFEFIPSEDVAMTAVRWLVSQTAGSLFLGVVAYIVFHVYCEKIVTLGEALSNGFARILPLLGTTLLVTLLTNIGMIPAFLYTAATGDTLLSRPLAAIPMLVVYCMLILSVPACAVEHLNPVQSLRRSLELTREFRLAIFWVLLVFVVLFWLTAMFATFAASIMGLRLNLGPLPAVLVVLVVLIMWSALLSILTAVIYHRLRELKDGVSSEDMVRAFNRRFSRARS